MITTSDKPTVDKVEEVSLIMALGRVNANVQQEGPSPSDTISGRFSDQLAELVFTTEQSFRDTHNLVKLKLDLAAIKLFAEIATKMVRALDVTSKEVQDDPGIYIGETTNIERTKKYAQLVYGDSFSWGWGYYKDGSWSRDVVDTQSVSETEAFALTELARRVVDDK